MVKYGMVIDISRCTGVSVDEVKDNSSFEIIMPPKIETSPEPPDNYLMILRGKINPTDIVLGK